MSTSPLDLSEPNSESPFRTHYDAAKHAAIEARHAAALKKSGDVPPTLDLGVPSTYRK